MAKRVGSTDATANAMSELADSLDKSPELVDKDIDMSTAEAIRKANNENNLGNTLLKAEEYIGFSPDIQTSRGAGLSSASVADAKTIDTSGVPKAARPATMIDVSKLDESMIMSMPAIKAMDNLVPSILFLKPKDSTIRFRWVNFKNYDGGNYQYFRALGFQNASIDDIDIETTPVSDSCKSGSEIKWYDVILMKVNVFVLMGHYKSNIQKSLRMVGRFQESALNEAQRQFNNDINDGLVDSGPNKGASLRSVLNRMKQANYDVQFYIPGLEEIVAQDKNFLQDSFAS